MKHLLLLLFSITAAYGQNLTIVDKATNEPVPFATVLLSKGDKLVFGSYCNDGGEILIDKKNRL